MSSYSDLMYKDMGVQLHYPYNYKCKISKPVGNNAFSYERRQEKSICIPAIIEGDLKTLSESNQYSFIELDDKEKEIKCKGVVNFIRDEHIFLFDNHNHSYYFLKIFMEENNIETINFVHVDQHKDMRKPEVDLAQYVSIINIEKEFRELGISDEEYDILKAQPKFSKIAPWFLYTQNVLNVGNFINPLLDEGIVDHLYLIDSEYSMDALKIDSLGDYVLDLDLDFFSKDMSYINDCKKLKFVQSLIDNAKAIFVATSPFFIEFDAAKRIVEILDWQRR